MTGVAECYGQDAEREWQRLVRDAYHGLEFTLTIHYLRRYLPPSGHVLDAGTISRRTLRLFIDDPDRLTEA